MLRITVAFVFLLACFGSSASARFASPWADEIGAKCRAAERYAMAAKELPVTGPHVAAGVLKACGDAHEIVILQKNGSSGEWLSQQEQTLIDGIRKNR